METWNLEAQRAAASRARAKAVNELLAQFAAWLRRASTISAPQARGRECFGTDC
jgi:hypothetical protein